MLNLVERRFAELASKCIRRRVHKTVPVLGEDIRDWIAVWNGEPKSYLWARTADEILEHLASDLSRTPDSEA